MRNLFVLPLVAVAALTASPAAARDPAPAPHPLVQRPIDVAQAGRLLSNPVVQDGLSAVIGQLADAFLQTRVGPLATLTDPRDGVRPDSTLGEVVRRDDPNFDARLRAHSRRALGTAGAALQGAGQLDRELRATAARLQAVLGQLDRY